MPNIIEITDFHAPELDPYARLTQNQLRSRLEPEKGIFIAESPKVISRALDAGFVPVSLLMERRQITGPAAEILTRCGDAPIYTADRELLAALTGYELTRGVLCAFQRPKPRTVEELCRNARRVAVLEGIVDSTNVGAIFRSAAALNMDAVLINPSCCDPLCRRAVRVSMGTVFQVPWAQIGETPADWPEKGLAQLNALGFKTAAMALSDRSVSIDDEALAREPKLAIVLGTEGDGLSASGREFCYALEGFKGEITFSCRCGGADLQCTAESAQPGSAGGHTRGIPRSSGCDSRSSSSGEPSSRGLQLH